MRRIALVVGLFMGCPILGGPVLAAEVYVPPAHRASILTAPPIISELRAGFSVQDPDSPESGSANITGEVLLSKFHRRPDWLDALIPRVHVGGSANFAGDTSFAYAGLTWTFDITPQLFVEGTLGGAVHNGDTSRFGVPGSSALGCSPLFRESASLGFRFNRQWSLMGTIEHLSNAGLCRQNRGLTNIGVRLGYQF